MKKIFLSQFQEMIAQGEKKFNDYIFEDMDLSNYSLRNMDFSYSNFIRVILKNVDFSNSSLVNALLDDCNLESTNLEKTDLRHASLKRANLKNINAKGTKFFAAVLEGAILENILIDEHTENFRLHCPEKGAFIAYKKGLDNVIIKLLIPSEAKRVSSTMYCCRCDKAKILEIKSFDGSNFYNEGWSTVKEDFCYKLGEWVYAEDFNENRWYDSTGGIHFWMTEEEAKLY